MTWQIMAFHLSIRSRIGIQSQEVVSRKRSQRLDKLAQLYDTEILPIWAERFGRMLLRDLPIPDKGQILDVACGTGYPAVEIIRRMGPDTRLIAIDPVSVMLDEARKKIEKMGARGVFFRTESAEPKLSFANDVYDLVVCNLGICDFEYPAAALVDFARVTRPGGHVRCTLPLAGSFQEFYDIYREVLTKHDKHQALENLEHHLEAYPTSERCESWLEAANLTDTRVEIDEFTLLFRSSREFFFAPVIEFGPLPAWKALVGRGQEMQDVFWYIKEAIDSYFSGRAFAITVKAGCLGGNLKKEQTESFPASIGSQRATPSAARSMAVSQSTRSASAGSGPSDASDDSNASIGHWDQEKIDLDNIIAGLTASNSDSATEASDMDDVDTLERGEAIHRPALGELDADTAIDGDHASLSSLSAIEPSDE